MVRYYYSAPLPDYLYEKYMQNQDSKSEDYIRFEKFLAGEDNAFIGRGAPRSNTEAHLRHLKQLKNPVDFMRYVKGGCFSAQGVYGGEVHCPPAP